MSPKSNVVFVAVRNWISYFLRVSYLRVIVSLVRREVKPAAAEQRDAILRLAQEMEFVKDEGKNECGISLYR
jgi:hypothetical protein